VLVLTEILIVAGNNLLGVDPFLKRMSAAAVVFMAFALVGLACGLGARYPRFAADNPSQIAGSYGGVAFMVLAVLFILVIIVLLGWSSSLYLFSQYRGRPLTSNQEILIAVMFATAAIVSIATWLLGMRTGVKALQEMDRTPS
jgi:Putative ATP-binding cassette